MNPAEHLAEAERLLAWANLSASQESSESNLTTATRAIGHALIAAAAELGVPHSETTTGGGPGAAQAQAG